LNYFKDSSMNIFASNRSSLVVYLLACSGFIASGANANPGVLFNDAIGDIDPGISTGNGTLDLVSMEVSHTATDIQFKLTVNGNISSTDWGKFMVGIANNKGYGTSSSDGWARPITMSANGGMTNWFGSWLDNGGGAENRSNQTSWGVTGATYNSNFGNFAFAAGAQSTITYGVSIASIGMSIGDTFSFDAYSSGGGDGDSAIDALANPSVAVTSWGQAYDSGTSTSLSYTLTAIPAPGAIALIGLAGLVARRRKA
jgi:hypothetical protein